MCLAGGESVGGGGSERARGEGARWRGRILAAAKELAAKELGGREGAWWRPRSSAAAKELAAKKLGGRVLGSRDIGCGMTARRRGIIGERAEVEARGDPCRMVRRQRGAGGDCEVVSDGGVGREGTARWGSVAAPRWIGPLLLLLCTSSTHAKWRRGETVSTASGWETPRSGMDPIFHNSSGTQPISRIVVTIF